MEEGHVPARCHRRLLLCEESAKKKATAMFVARRSPPVLEKRE
jgi:hypothetical protein